MHAFIVRPFGVKKEIDFDHVERELIDPVLRQLSIGGRTTLEIVDAGDIREDMFELLVTADLVIADISVHNANVFYELGIRHAICDRHTFLIRCRCDEMPFDLRTDRYLEYDAAAPAAAIPALVDAIRATLDSLQPDSPVFRLLPELRPQDRTRLLVVPAEFREEVRRAEKEGYVGDLGFLAEEARGFRWAIEGLRTVGVAQISQKAFEPARTTWERVREGNPDDIEANTRLATIYQKTGDLTRSDTAVERALSHADLRRDQRAELHGLRGSNAKTRWIAEWDGLEDPVRRRTAALNSPWLEEAFREYRTGFASDRNHHYAGLNALLLLKVTTSLAYAVPDVWTGRFASDDAAQRALDRFAKESERMAVALEDALEVEEERLEFESRDDPWLRISGADLACLNASRPAYVARRYEDALRDASRFSLFSVRRQLQILIDLEVCVENARAAVAVLEEELAKTEEEGTPPTRVLLFTGHRIDAPGREHPRFPAAAEPMAREMIRKVVTAELERGEGRVIGLAGAASGGDILFHEVCVELGIETELYLAGSRDAFVVASVQPAGPDWVARFDRLCATRPTRVLADTLALPRWLRPLRDYSIWQRNNLWILHNALVYGAAKVTLVALWNGEGADGPGGTRDMVQECVRRGARVVKVDASPLAALTATTPSGIPGAGDDSLRVRS